MADYAASRNLNSQLEQCIPRIQFYQNVARIRQDMQGLFYNCTTLKPSVGSFKTSTGSSITLFYLSGVIPITYNGSKYNIPITIYFDPPYPNQPPRVFVTPTADMVIKQNHRTVDQNGRVYLPQLSSWSAASSSVVDIVGVLSSAFSTEPPVNAVAKRATIVSEPAVLRAPVVAVSSRREVLLKSINPKVYAKLRARLQAEIDGMNASAVSYGKLSQLRERMNFLSSTSTRIASKTDQVLLTLASAKSETEAWIWANRDQTDDDAKKNQNAVSALEAESAVGQQVIDLMAEMCALEDMIDCVQELHRAGRITMADRLREVRSLTRRLFELKYIHRKATTLLQAVGSR